MLKKTLSAMIAAALMSGCAAPKPEERIVYEQSARYDFLTGKALAERYLTGNISVLYDQKNKKTIVRPQPNVAVVMVDMQDAFLDGIAPEEKKDELPKQSDMLYFAAHFGIPVFVLEYKCYGSTTSYLQRQLDWIKERTNVDTITKSSNDAFKGTDLENKLREKGIRNIILMGINGCCCVYDTAISSRNKGFTVMTSGDLIADPYSLENTEWYKKNGVYRDSHTGLIELLTDTN